MRGRSQVSEFGAGDVEHRFGEQPVGAGNSSQGGVRVDGAEEGTHVRTKRALPLGTSRQPKDVLGFGGQAGGVDEHVGGVEDGLCSSQGAAVGEGGAAGERSPQGVHDAAF